MRHWYAYTNIVCIATRLDANQSKLLNRIFVLSKLCVKIYIDGAIPRLDDKFGHFMTVNRYEDLHKSKNTIILSLRP